MNTHGRDTNCANSHELNWRGLASVHVLVCSQQSVRLLLLLAFCSFLSTAGGLELTVDSSNAGKEIDLTCYALGQGGLSDRPMFDPHVEQVAQLHPQTIRIFVQEFFGLYPEPGRYHWDTLDRVVEKVLEAKAKPILCLCFKPKALYPQIDQHLVHPSNYA